MPEPERLRQRAGPHAAAQEPDAVTLAGDAVSISITARSSSAATDSFPIVSSP